MKKHASTIILILVFIVGLSVLLYPTVSNLINQRNQSRSISGYREQVGKLDSGQYAAVLENAQEYNRNHTKNDFSIPDENAMTEEYLAALSVNGSNIIGYLEIEEIGVYLGIYHGVSESVLQAGVGHLPQTSLPVPGESVHAVLSGHTGLPSADLLTDLDQLQIGDTFAIHILKEVYVYEVDQILVVLPEELDSLGIIDGEDHVTLVTCTPYGVNSHRLLVRGVAADYYDEEVEEQEFSADAVAVDSLIVATIIAVPVLLILFLIILIRIRKSRK